MTKRAWGLGLVPLIAAGCVNDGQIIGGSTGNIALTAGDFDDVQAPFNRMDVETSLFEGVISTATWDTSYDPDGTQRKVEALFGEDAALTEYGRLIIASGTRGMGLRQYNSVNPDDAFVSDPEVITRVTNFVERGGLLFCTDWSYDLIEAVFPDLIEFYGDDATFDDAQKGEIGTVTGAIVSESLATTLGSEQLSLRYDFSNWSVPTGVGEDTEVLITGDTIVRTGTETGAEPVTGAPLLVRAQIGNNGGTVVFSSFHLDAQTPGMIDQLLPFLIGSLEKEKATVQPIGQE